MKSLSYYFISLVLFGDTLLASEIFGIDIETITRWEVLAPAAILLLAIFVYQWRKAMRLKQRSVRIQFLDD
jgi:predicted exporter